MENFFTEEELSCPCCGVNGFNQETLIRLNTLRYQLGFPFPVNSGYRCEKYNARKGYTQTHATGQAIDLGLSHQQAFDVVIMASDFKFTGIGVRQHGPVSGRFIHLDDLKAANKRPRPHIWSYK